MKRGIYADYVDKKAVITLLIEDDGSVLAETGIAYGSMNKWLTAFKNRTERVLFPVPEDCIEGELGWENTWCILRCSGCHRSISSQRDTMSMSSVIPLRSRGYQPMYFQMIPIPVNVSESWFFNGECWGDVPCTEADPVLYEVDPNAYQHFKWCKKKCTRESTKAWIEKQMLKIKARWSNDPRLVEGYFTRFGDDGPAPSATLGGNLPGDDSTAAKPFDPFEDEMDFPISDEELYDF